MEHDRIVTCAFYWNNAHKIKPYNGQKVRVLNRDGVDAGTATWNEDSILYFDGWLPFAKIPEDIKSLQLGRYLTKNPTALCIKLNGRGDR